MSFNKVELVESPDAPEGGDLEHRTEGSAAYPGAATNGDGMEIALESPVSTLSVKYNISVRDYSLIPYAILTGLSIVTSEVSFAEVFEFPMN